jgi:aminoglycoside phosphotransferase (APT) family kinase protein
VIEMVTADPAAWLSDVLGTDVRSVDVEPLGAGTAFLGRLTRLVVVHDDPEIPDRFILKAPTDDPGGREVGRLLNAWRREALFYRHLAPALGRSVPAAYHVSDDGELLLLADLHPWAPGDQVAGATATQARSAVDRLAELHAPWWGRPRSDESAWVPGIDQPRVTGLQDVIAAALPRFEAHYGDRLPAAPTQWLGGLVPRLADLLRGFAAAPLTIAHADYRVENMLFSPDGTQVAVIDWQTAMYTAGASDMAFFVATNIEVDERRRIEYELLERYVEGLHRHGVSQDQTAAVADQYRAALLWWMAMLANNLSTIEPPDERGRQLFDAMLTRLWTAAQDHEVDEIIGDL